MGHYVVGAGYLHLSASGTTLLRIMVEFRPTETLISWIGMGLLLPLVLTRINHTGFNFITGLLAVFGTWMLRWVMFIGGQGMPKKRGPVSTTLTCRSLQTACWVSWDQPASG